MHGREEADYRPLVRRAWDAAGVSTARRWRRSVDGLRDGFFYVVTLPGLLLFNWWERFRLASGWERVQNLMLGFPAVVLGAGALFVGVQTSKVSGGSLLQRYHRDALVASESNDSRTALILFTRMRELDRNSPFALFEMARQYERLGKHEQAASLLRQLAAMDESGDPRAHRWLARMLLKRQHVPYASELALRHLASALAIDPDDAEANALLGQEALREGKAKEAHDYFARAAKRDGQYNVGLARSMAALGRAADAELIAILAEPLFRDRLRNNPNDQEARIRMSEIHALRRRYPQAVNVLREGLGLPQADEIQLNLARIYVVWGMSMPPSSTERWRLWEEAFRVDARSPDLVRTLLAAGDQNPHLRGRIQDLLDRLRENSLVSVEAELINALIALAESDEGRAAVHLKRVAGASTSGDEVLADLARIRGLKHALTTQWVELGLKQWESSAILKRVRAELLFHGGKYRESLLELNALAPDVRDDPTIHALLADAYSKLGREDEAAEHRRRAQPLLEFTGTKDGTK